MPTPAYFIAMRRHREAQMRRGTTERIFRPRISLFGMSDYQVMRTFRFPPPIILEITRALEPALCSPTDRSHAVPPLLKVLTTLQFCGTGSFQRTAGAIAGLSQATSSRCIHQVIPALVDLMDTHLIPPVTPALRQSYQESFYNICGFPGVIGALDCTHVALKPPSATEHIYRNRKHWHSINVQVICDANNLIWHVRAKHPGSSHDSYVFRRSTLPQQFADGLFEDSWLLGDSAYALGPHLLTPIRKPSTRAERKYNAAHIRTRGVIERTFGILKSRFRCLDKSGGTLQYGPTFVCSIIGACVVLHNIATRRGLDVDICDDLTPPPPVCAANECGYADEGVEVRANVVSRFFTE